MKKFIVATFLASTTIFLSGCNTTEQANAALAQKYQGTEVDSFFLKYGPPIRSHRTRSGDMIYIWAEEARNHYIPGTAYTYGTGNYATTNFVGGGMVNIQCQLKVLVDRRGKIKEIVAHKDTSGEWDLSRCHEVFGKTQ